MNSFELPISRWREIEAELRHPLEEIEELRAGFADTVDRIDRAVQRLDVLALPGLSDVAATSRGVRSVRFSQVEAFSFFRRHRREAPNKGYQRVLQRISAEYDKLELSPDLLREMHRQITSAGASGAGEWKKSMNFVPIYRWDGRWIASRITVEAERVPELMAGLHEKLHAFLKSDAVHPLMAIGAYTLDVLGIHPFTDGNGRVFRLAMALLLHQAGHHLTRRASLEAVVARKRTAYCTSLEASWNGWEAVKHDPLPWCKFTVDVVGDAYREVLTRTARLESLVNQLSAVTAAAERMPARFAREDLKHACRGVPDPVVSLVLQRLQAAGRIHVVNDGSVTRWYPAKQRNTQDV